MRENGALQIHKLAPERSAALRLTLLLPPLVLFAALALTLGRLFGAPFDLLALLAGAAACACALLPTHSLRLAGPALAAGAALALALLPTAREGAMLLMNRLFAASEAANAYAYRAFAVREAGSASALRLSALLATVLLGALCAAVCRRRAWIVTLFLGVVALEAYFGVTPGVWRNALLFVVLALMLVPGGEAKSAAALLAGIAAIALAVCLTAPRPNAAVEAYSEHLRDELSAAALRFAQPSVQPEEADVAHLESRQHEEAARPDEAREDAAQAFERQTRDERELSLPRRLDLSRIALGLLAVVALLTVPFLPFLLFDRAKRRTAERRAAFADADNAAAIRAMFAHTMDWLRAAGLQTENRTCSQCGAAVEALTDAAYAARYTEAVPIWQEAAYSRHAMTDGQRRAVRELLDETARTLYAKADRRTKFRMKYVEHLCGS